MVPLSLLSHTCPLQVPTVTFLKCESGFVQNLLWHFISSGAKPKAPRVALKALCRGTTHPSTIHLWPQLPLLSAHTLPCHSGPLEFLQCTGHTAAWTVLAPEAGCSPPRLQVWAPCHFLFPEHTMNSKPSITPTSPLLHCHHLVHLCLSSLHSLLDCKVCKCRDFCWFWSLLCVQGGEPGTQ
jgi:hypothetical protein